MKFKTKLQQMKKNQFYGKVNLNLSNNREIILKKILMRVKKDLKISLKIFKKKGNQEKEKLENASQNSISSLEQKYQTQIKEMQETHQKLYSELLISNKDLDRELKSLNFQNEINKGKAIDPAMVNKKIEELIEEREKLKKDIEEQKKERDNKLLELQVICEKEKDVLKNKINEYENKSRDGEGKRGVLMLEYEKDKAKWNIEKDHFLSKVAEYQDNTERSEKRYETLLRENEKLKNEKNNIKRSVSGLRNPNATILGNNSILGGINKGDTSTFIPKDVNSKYSDQPRTYIPTGNTSSNPYTKDLSKILDNLDTVNTSKIMPSDKSFERYDSTSYGKYDNSYSSSNSSGKFSTNNKYPIKPTSTNTSGNTSLNIKEEENGNGNTELNK